MTYEDGLKECSTNYEGKLLEVEGFFNENEKFRNRDLLGIRGWIKQTYKKICDGNKIRLKATNHPNGLKEEKCFFLHGIINNNLAVKNNIDCDSKLCMYCEKINP